MFTFDFTDFFTDQLFENAEKKKTNCIRFITFGIGIIFYFGVLIYKVFRILCYANTLLSLVFKCFLNRFLSYSRNP